MISQQEFLCEEVSGSSQLFAAQSDGDIINGLAASEKAKQRVNDEN